MTKRNTLTLKVAILSALGVSLTFFLGNTAMTTLDAYVSAFSQMGAFVLGMFSLIGVISTLVMFLVDEE
jgi:hypothetical protein